MAVQGQEVGTRLTYAQRVGALWDVILEGHRVTQGHLAASERAHGDAIAAGVPTNEFERQHIVPEFGQQPADERRGYVALAAYKRAEEALEQTRVDFAMRIASELLLHTVSVRVLEPDAQRMDNGKPRATGDITGRFKSFDPISTEMHLVTPGQDGEEGVDHYVRLVRPDLTRGLVRTANIMAVDFPEAAL